MKYRKFVITTAVISLALFCISCSWFSRFVIINKSGEPIEIRLKYEPLSGERNLRKTNLDEKGKFINENWKQLAPEKFQDNKPEEIVTLKLAPNEALIVAEELNYTGHNSGDAEFFKIKELDIKGAGGAIHLEGKQVLFQFREEEETLYTLIYQ
jgi:hypothetical protein